MKEEPHLIYEHLSVAVPAKLVTTKDGGSEIILKNTLHSIPCDCRPDGHCNELCGHSINLEDVEPIYICNRNCPCAPECCNRLPNPETEHDIIRLEKKGWCLMASQILSPHHYIGDYTGLIISSNEAKKRHSVSQTNFILTLREESLSGCLVTHIDAATHGNTLRFMNHSCDPNVVIVLVRDDEVYPRATCWTSRPVNSGEELCFSYGSEELGTVPCLCGSSKCRGFLPLEPF